MDRTAAVAICYEGSARMKRLSVVASLAWVVSGVVYGCAEPEELDPAVVKGAEDYYFALMANQPAPAPTPSNTAPPAIPPAGTAPLAPANPPDDPAAADETAADEVEPPNSIPLETWLRGR